MKKAYNFLIAGAVLATFTSCGDSTGDLENLAPVPVPSAVTKFLKQATITPAGGSVYNINYNYTNSALFSVVYGNTGNTFKMDYANSQISKITETSASYNVSAIFNPVYNSGQLTQLNGSITPDMAFQSTLTYTNGKVTNFQCDYTHIATSALEVRKKLTLEYSGDNITKAILIQENFVPAGTTTTTTVMFSNFDANPNPYKTIPMQIAFAQLIRGFDVETISALSVNNYKTVTVHGGGISTTTNVTYTYDPQTYPTKYDSPTKVQLFSY